MPAETGKSALEVADEALNQPNPGFHLTELDLPRLIAEGIGGERWLYEPYLPERADVWAFDAAGSGKSLFFQQVCAELTTQGIECAYISEENPLAVDVDRFRRLRPDFGRLRVFHQSGIDLNEQGHLLELALKCQGVALIVLDTLTAVWNGDEQSNRDIASFDRAVVRSLIRLTGATVVVVHHVGHPVAFVRRGGVNAGRGASSMGQKADVVLVFKEAEINQFIVDVAKNRMGHGRREPPTRFKIADTESGHLTIERMSSEASARVDECAGVAVEVIRQEQPISTTQLKRELEGRGFGSPTVRAALDFLGSESSSVSRIPTRMQTKDGKERSVKAWVVPEPGLLRPSGAEGGLSLA
jgi:hypothetical protein